jgi:hypothetical protein
MQAPKCRTCGVSHWLRDGHQWPKSDKQTVTHAPIKRNAHTQPVTHKPVTHTVTHADKTAATRQARYRMTHMDEYRQRNRERMRVDRAAKRVSTH